VRITKYIPLVILPFLLVGSIKSADADTVSNADFESGNFTGWEKGAQTGNMAPTITGSGTGVSIINGTVTFNAPPGNQVGTPGSQYYQPATPAAVWKFSPYGSYAAALQPAGQANFNTATSALGLSSAENTSLRGVMTSQASASKWGQGNPTDAAWITRNVTLSAGVTYTMSWNYIGTDYVPFNDGSITSLTPIDATSSATITVNNQVQRYALLGFTNPGTGDYSTGTYGSTGWQVSTYQVSATGEYKLGFAVFNLDDNALSPVLLVDSEPGGTLKNDQQFGAVPPNNSNAPTVPPTTQATTTTEAPTTTTTEPEVTTTTEPEVSTTVPETTTTVIETTTTAPAPTTEAPRPIYIPSPVVTVETTTTTIPDTTTTIIEDTIPNDTIPIDSIPISELPKTGSSSQLFNIGAGLIIIGLFISYIRKWLYS